ncbi:hypothetical protein K502DRAFT_301000 [Neoconidiobolus thromboides FSU 785]|nr:hypothetical protein K502DRAFT_301000 [Neoconidiobolus thromboides FSU 785]
MRSSFKLLLFNCLVSIILSEEPNYLRGVPPHKVNLYSQDPNKFACFDNPTKLMDIKVVNDDYCDCKDGSDEPGTSACPNSTFYCDNEGHIPATILSSRVNDGICDEACCDGSDEYDGKIQCPNRCKELAEKANKELNQKKEILKKGLEKKTEYIKEYSVLKEKFETQIVEIKKEIDQAKLKVEELKKIKEEKEAIENQAEKDHQASASTRANLLENQVSTLKSIIEELQEKIEHLDNVLKDLKLNHNQNYHDMAVKGAITAYNEFHESYNKIDMNNDERFKIIDPQSEVKDSSNQGESFGFNKNIINNFKTIINVYYTSIKYNLLNFIYPFSTTIVTDASNARTELWNAESTLSNKESELKSIEDKLTMDYGPLNSYAYLNEKCFDKTQGDYVYTVCIFGDAHQKSNNGENIFLGKFSSWSNKSYQQQDYTGGTQCWNGPQRSVKLFLTCGIEELITEITEPEKCEYHFHMTTPAACEEKEIENEKIGNDNIIEHDEL